MTKTEMHGALSTDVVVLLRDRGLTAKPREGAEKFDVVDAAGRTTLTFARATTGPELESLLRCAQRHSSAFN